jgi:glycosyltransferase involved in cell wall biosynthesis
LAVYLFSNLLSGSTGLDKSTVMTANHLHRSGRRVVILNFVGPGDGVRYLAPRWPLDDGVQVFPLQALAPYGGRHLHENLLPSISGRIPNLSYSFTPNALYSLRQLNSLLGKQDHVLFTHPLQSYVFMRAIDGDRRLVRTSLQVHGNYRLLYPELQELFERSRSVIDQLQVVARGMSASLAGDFEAEDIHWIPNIHHPSQIYRQGGGGVSVAMVGSFQETKNQIDAVRMISRVSSSDMRLVLWGNYSNEYGRYVVQFVERHGLSGRVSLPGIGTEQQIYGTADIVIIPSRAEGFGYALLEAAAHALPVVAYDYDFGPRDAIDDGHSGYIVDIGDVDAMASRVDQLAADAELRSSMGAAAKAIFNERFAPARIVERYDALLGNEAGSGPDLIRAYTPDQPGPVESSELRSPSVIRFRGRTVLRVIYFRSDSRLHRFQVQSSDRVKRARALRVGARYLLPALTGDPGGRFHKARQRVFSYELKNSDRGRFYLGHTSRSRRFDVARYLLRDDSVAPPQRPSSDEPTTSSGTCEALIDTQHQSAVVARHPRFPVVAGVDNFGESINTVGGVMVENGGSLASPVVFVRGEYDAVELSDASQRRQLVAPYGYGELFERVCAAEREGGLFAYEDQGVYPWELYRSACITHLCQGLGFWGEQFGSASGSVLDSYFGPKRLAEGNRFRRVVFEFTRKPDGVDNRTVALHGEDTMIIEYPQEHGYSSQVYTKENYFPIREFNAWKAQRAVSVGKRVDAGPIEDVLSRHLGFPVSIGTSLDARMRKFREEREFWSVVFDRIRPEEVVIPASHWSAGICAAAESNGALVSDLQYALTSRHHPTFWFGGVPHYGASNLLAWSDFWARRTNVYSSSAVVPRGGIDLTQDSESLEPRFEYCVISQPRVSRRIMRLLEEFVQLRPGSAVCVAPHPDERDAMRARVAELAAPNISVAAGSTLAAIRESEICVGGYSTSMYEAAALGKPVYVLPVPGHEITNEDTRSGLFRAFSSVEELTHFDVPSVRHQLFPPSP